MKTYYIKDDNNKYDCLVTTDDVNQWIFSESCYGDDTGSNCVSYEIEDVEGYETLDHYTWENCHV